MRISNISFYTPNKITNKNGSKQKDNKSLPLSCSAYENKNLSFRGEKIYNATLRRTDIELVPFKEYYVDDTAVFESAGFKIDLASDELKRRVKNLKRNEKFIIGRDETQLKNMPNTVSRRHLQIKRNPNGLLSACDLNSTNGTTLKSNYSELDTNIENQELKAGRYFLLPYNAVLNIGGANVHLLDYKEQISSLRNGTALIIGRNEDTDIKIPSIFVSGEHLSLQPYQDKVLVKDLHSTNGTTFEYCDETDKDFQAINNFSTIKETKTLKKGVKTVIPNDCQIYLGKDFTIDMRNKNILEVLEQKGEITIGRDKDCDLVVDEFYSHVSRIHLQLEKKGNKLFATDLNSSNDTQIIPKNKIKAFNGGVQNIQLGQANIGDCYLLSVLYALSSSPKGQKYIEKMVKVDDNGNYAVKFYDCAKPINIAPEDLDGQSNAWSKKRSVSGDLGIRAIERAYGRLLCGDIGRYETLFSEIDDGGLPITALKKLTGIDSDFISIEERKIQEKLYDICKKGLNNYILTCATPAECKYNGYVDPQQRFNSNHAFGIKNINPYKKTIEIVNPHNTKKSHTIGWHEFGQMFDYLFIGEYDK